ncbi:MAG: hypothetical protein Q8922_00425 [Bacteroidota bacterium]|nr:hypothetical protein [Bacteroidota bacterium]MDP4232498.1 hypothetical protein [Bacteroidota bacterium]MDP4241634.1 hypothetical protein [Bacteroidota bacterium]MDP4286378.1 hypothetical protein [Bacteroidota bacterium]
MDQEPKERQEFQYSLKFGNLSYFKDTDGSIQVGPAAVTALLSGTGSIVIFDGTQYNESGNWYGNETIQDTLYLRLGQPRQVETVAHLAEKPSLRILQTTHSIGFSYDLKESSLLLISNSLGRIVYDQLIHAQESMIQIPSSFLPPGCYFARLGTEVAKFCVVE